MYQQVIRVDGKEYDSVYAFVKDRMITMSPTYLHREYLSHLRAGQTTVLTLDKYKHFRGCDSVVPITVSITLLEDL